LVGKLTGQEIIDVEMSRGGTDWRAPLRKDVALLASEAIEDELNDVFAPHGSAPNFPSPPCYTQFAAVGRSICPN
jgi:hypothetical protein